jgi:hypothetical protein
MKIIRQLNVLRAVNLLILAGIFVFVGSTAVAQKYLFDHAELVTGNGPAGVVVTDFNNDHRLDLAVTNSYDATVSILLGERNGAFATGMTYATGATPVALVTADFRGNGKVDLAIVNENEGSGTNGSVSILLGNGNGTFKIHVDYPVGNFPVGIVAADFNGDGKIDLAVVNDYDSTVSILLGNGDGTFQSQTIVQVGTGPTSLGSGDFNGDGKVDLVTSNVGSATVSALLNEGNGSFTRVDSPSPLSGPDTSMLVTGDFNGDGKLDVVVSSRIYQQLFLLLGEGNGSLGTPSTIPTAPFDPVTALVVGDFNHDGKLDLASGGYDEVGGIVVSLGKGDGTFKLPVVSPCGPIGAMAVADVNGDGQLDLIAANQSNSVGLFLGEGDGTFSIPKPVALAKAVYGVDATVVADFNGDGKPDLAVAEVNFPHGRISVELGDGNGTFSKPVTSPLLSEAINNQDLMRAGDFNGDGKPDLLILDDYGTGFQILLGNGDGTFHTGVNTPLSYTVSSLAVGDLNGDGQTDVVVTTNGSSGNPSTNIYLSNGDGTFRSGVQYTGDFYAGVTVADVNQDGKLDLVIDSFGEPLLVLLGNGDGTFQEPITGPTALYSGGLVIGDFNGDGKPDVAVGTYSGMAFLAGNGDGTFLNPVYSNSTYQFCCQMLSGDFNGDGKLDLVTVNAGAGVLVMVGNGDGTFQSMVPLDANGQVYGGDMVVADFNSDGVDDIALANVDLYSGATTASLYLSAPTVVLFPSSVTFGPEHVGNMSTPIKVTLSNSGNAKLEMSAVTVSGDFFQQNNCGKSLAIGRSCTLQVSFKPTTKGVRKGAIKIKDNAVPSPQTVVLEGTGQ